MLLVRLVVFEAWNISPFMLVTNKRREIAGASELITYLDRQWVHDALQELFAGFDPERRIEEQPAELVEAGAGTVKVLVRDRDRARELVSAVTLRALREAPGLDVFGVVSEQFDWDTLGSLAAAVSDVRAGSVAARLGRPGPDVRFRRLPVVDECASTGLPAQLLARDPEDRLVARSAESQAKWVAYGLQDSGHGLDRLAELAGVQPHALKASIRHLSDTATWVGVVYADTNGLGAVFQALESAGRQRPNREYVAELRDLSGRLRACAAASVREAIEQVESVSDMKPAVVPLIVGGDDLVLLCDGVVALPLAEAYLRAFERATAADPTVSTALERTGATRLSCSCGVAIVKAHFPFDSAVRLAQALLEDEAKQVKDAVPGSTSALAFHVLYDSTDVDLARIRAKTSREPAVHLIAQPYVVSDPVDEPVAWARGRHWDDLLRRANALSRRDDDGERLIPASQAHDLREALFAGLRVADARYANLRQRYGQRGLGELAGEPGSLFWRDGEGQHLTGLLDAMDAVEFLPVEDR